MQSKIATACFLAAALSLAEASHLNITTIAARDGSSVLECWQLNSTLASSSQPGTAGALSSALGNVANMTYAVLPAGFNGGTHNAPFVQWVAFTSGLAHITLPDDPTSEAFVVGGEFGLILAADTAAVSKLGHITTYPGVTETVALEIPTENGIVPPHTVLHAGACNASEIAGIRNVAASSS